MDNREEIKKVNKYFFVTALVGLIAEFFYPFKTDSMVVQLIYTQVIFLLPSVAYMILNHKKYITTVRLKKMSFGNIILTILFGLLFSPVLTFVNALSLVFTKNSVSGTMISLTNEVPWIIGMLVVTVLPAICEETVYRGVLFNEYGKYDMVKGALLSGLIFGLMHRNLNQFSYAFVMGFIFGLMIEATGSILSTMILHFMTNGTSVTLLYLYRPLYEFVQKLQEEAAALGETDTAEMLGSAFGDTSLSYDEWIQSVTTVAGKDVIIQSLPGYALNAVIFGILAFLIYRIIAKNTGNWEKIKSAFTGKTDKKGSWKDLFTPYCIAGIAICVGIMVLYEISLALAGNI